MLLNQGSQPQPLPKLCFCTLTLIHWLIFLAWPWALLITVGFSGDVVCWFSPGCCHPSCLGTVSLLPCQWGHGFCLLYYHLSCHLSLPWCASCSCCSLTRCTQSMLIRLGFSGNTDREHRPVHVFQNWEEKQLQKHFLELPRSSPSWRWEEKNRTEYPVTQSTS